MIVLHRQSRTADLTRVAMAAKTGDASDQRWLDITLKLFAQAEDIEALGLDHANIPRWVSEIRAKAAAQFNLVLTGTDGASWIVAIREAMLREIKASPAWSLVDRDADLWKANYTLEIQFRTTGPIAPDAYGHLHEALMETVDVEFISYAGAELDVATYMNMSGCTVVTLEEDDGQRRVENSVRHITRYVMERIRPDETVLDAFRRLNLDLGVCSTAEEA